MNHFIIRSSVFRVQFFLKNIGIFQTGGKRNRTKRDKRPFSRPLCARPICADSSNKSQGAVAVTHTKPHNKKFRLKQIQSISGFYQVTYSHVKRSSLFVLGKKLFGTFCLSVFFLLLLQVEKFSWKSDVY